MVRSRAVFGMSALMAGALAGVALVSSCKDDTPTTLPTVKAPTTVKGPTREEVLAKSIEDAKINLKDYDKIPDLGPHIMYQTPDGEMWQKYSNNMLIQVLRVGNRTQPRVGQEVTVAYRGMYTGSLKEFDSMSADRPFKFILGKKNTVIEGWHLAISTMRVGGKIKVFLPPDLAYGAEGKRPTIPGNTALIFEIELLAVTGDPVEFPATTMPETAPSIETLKSAPMGPSLPATKPAAKD